MRAITPRTATALLALAFIAANPAAVRSQTPAPDGFAVVATKNLHTGVEYVKLAKSKTPVVAHVAHVLPGAPVKLQVVNALDRISTRPAELERTSSMCERTKCIVGVNGDFHKIGVPAGAVIAGGRMLHSPEVDRPQLTVLKDGRLVAGSFPWTGTVTGPAGIHIPIGTVNAAPPPNGLSLFTPEHGRGTADSPRVEVVVRAARIGVLNQPATVELVSLRTGAGPIPADGAVLSGDGSAGQQLRDLWARRHASGPPARILISSPLDADVSLGVEPVVLRDGKRALPWRDPNVINPRQPHTLVGWNKEGHVYLIAVDGRQAASEGVTMAEAADFLVGLGVTEAVSLDGGGGTTFVAGGSVWNRPSDNDPARPGTYTERGATNALVLLPRAEAPAPAKAPAGSPAARPIKPMGAPAETGGGGDDDGDDSSSLGPTWIAGPMTVEGEVALPGPSADGSALEPQLNSAGPAGVATTPGREMTTQTAGDNGEAHEDRSLVDPARSDRDGDDDGSPSEGDYLQSTLSVAAELAGPASADKPSGRGAAGILQLLLGGSALSAAGLATRTRTRRRPVACVRQAAAEPAAVVDAEPPLTEEVAAEAEPVVELLIEPEEPVIDLTVGTGPLFEFTRLDGFHRLVLDNTARARIRANRLQVQRTKGAGVAPRRARPAVDQKVRPADLVAGDRRIRQDDLAPDR